MKLDSSFKRLSAAVFIATMLVTSGYADGLKPEVTIAIFPCTDVVSSFEKFHPLVTYLNQYARLDSRVVFYQDSDSYERAIKNGELDFVLQDPHVYARFADLYDRTSLLRTLTGEGNSSQSGVVIVRKDSGLHRLIDLKGKTVMFGPKVSSARWVAAKALFKDSGVDIDTDVAGYSNGGCCEDIAFSVYLKAVDAGVVCDHFLSEHSNKQRELGVDARQIVVIGMTQLVPTKVFTATKKVDPEIVARVNQALLSLDMHLPSHQTILNHAELGGFLKSDDRDAGPMKKILDIGAGN